MFPCIACHFPISLCQILHLATINVIIVTKVAGGNPIEFLLPEPSGTALFIFIQKQPLCRPSSQTVGVDLCIELFHHRYLKTDSKQSSSNRTKGTVDITVQSGSKNQEVKIVVKDDDGSSVIYDDTNKPGDRIVKNVSGVGNVRIQVYLNGALVQDTAL